jgi:hypothetical protein
VYTDVGVFHGGVVGGETGVCVAEWVADADGVALALVSGLWLALGEADFEVALWLGEGLVDGQDESLGEGDGDAVAVPVGEPVALADADGSVALADALAEPELPEEGVGDPEQGVGVGVDVGPEAAMPAVAGITSRAPIATVPVATAPTTDAADRPFRACLGTVAAPNCCRSSVLSDHAPQRTHEPTVTNSASPGHPRGAR